MCFRGIDYLEAVVPVCHDRQSIRTSSKDGQTSRANRELLGGGKDRANRQRGPPVAVYHHPHHSNADTNRLIYTQSTGIHPKCIIPPIIHQRVIAGTENAH
jgi:hypothetical protein